MGETRPCRRDKEDFRPLTTCPQGGTHHQTAYIPDGIHHQTAHTTRRHTRRGHKPKGSGCRRYTQKKGTIPVSPSSRVAGISLLTDCRTVPALISWQEHNGEKEAHMAGKGMPTEAGQLPQGIMTGSKQCHHAAMHGHEQPRTITKAKTNPPQQNHPRKNNAARHAAWQDNDPTARLST